MDFKRVLSSIILLPMVILLIVFTNKYIIDVVVSIITIISLYEYYKAVSKESKPIKWLGYVLAALISIIHIVNIENLYKALTFLVPIVISILFIEVIIKNMKLTFKDLAYSAFGIFYIVFFLMFLALTAGINNGKIFIWYAFISAWATDVFAYIIGKRMGKHKFSKVSPKKSIEGCIAGIIGTIILTFIYTYIINKTLYIRNIICNNINICYSIKYNRAIWRLCSI